MTTDQLYKEPYESPIYNALGPCNFEFITMVYVDETETIKEPYFKLMKGITINSAEKFTRIKFLKPEYYLMGDENWILDEQEKEELVKFLNEVIRKDSQYTNWMHLVNKHNKEHECGWTIMMEDYSKIIMPDYMKLEKE